MRLKFHLRFCFNVVIGNLSVLLHVSMGYKLKSFFLLFYLFYSFKRDLWFNVVFSSRIILRHYYEII